MYVNIHISENSDDKTCKISKNIFDKLNVTEGKEYVINFGQIGVNAYVKPDISNNDSIYIPSEIFKKLYLIENLSLNIWRDGDSILLGPIIGIVEDTAFTNMILKEKPHISTFKYSEVSKENNCFTYFLSKGSINLENKIAKGCYYNTVAKKWTIDNFPIPNVIYARKFSSDIQRRLKDLKNIKYINNNKKPINKGEIYNRLDKYPEMRKYLADTRVYKNFEDVEEMLLKHNFIFLKSFRGSSGIEVMSVEKLKNQYEINFFSKKDNEHKKFRIGNLSELKKVINRFFYKKSFIIQQGIKLLKYKGHKMDLRILIQRDSAGQWKVITYLVRLAKGSSNITNHAIGGSNACYDDVCGELASSLDRVQLPTKRQLEEETINIATHIEKEYGMLGEIGMDIGIDEKGKIWFIEANLGPSNSPHPCIEKGFSDIYESIIHYSMYLLGVH